MGSQNCKYPIIVFISACALCGCFSFKSSDDEDGGTDTQDTADSEVDTADSVVDTADTEFVDTEDTDTNEIPGTTTAIFGVSSAGDRLVSANYQCDLVVGLPANGKLESNNHSVILTAGTVVESLKD